MGTELQTLNDELDNMVAAFDTNDVMSSRLRMEPRPVAYLEG